ncbi:MAG: CRISPR-associated helicase Cas3' [Peptococcaceae bacterium]|nr:MAG: CRISPR-associated helicase Cas3' [Peptococcaceae bacterium]
MFIAHSANLEGKEHVLKDHLLSVAALAGAFADKFGAAPFGYWAGLLHDIGKFSIPFQEYINNPLGKKKVDHSSAGALVARLVWDFLSFPIAGHHGGLADGVSLKERLHKKNFDSVIKEAIDTAKNNLPELNACKSVLDKLPSHLKEGTQVELFTRLVFSALVDADFLDTEKHFSPEKAPLRGTSFDLNDLWRELENDQGRLTEGRSGLINSLRQEIYSYCCQAAGQPPGVFRLTVPTGGGKTRSGMAFALRHAIHHGLDRVIVAIPYTSIIEQNADEYRNIFGPEAVLEHHSAVEFPDDPDDVSGKGLKARLAAENWDAPVIVTTTVQLFESLFSNRTSRCRKLHNVTGSVLILDEVQTLPVELLTPILDVLRELTENYGVSVVLCTATQPALDDSPYLKGLRNVREIVPEPGRYFSLMKRVHYEIPAITEKWSWEQAASRMLEARQCLAVVNTKKDALALLDALNDPGALHLSTLLCGAHRREVIAEVRRRLESGQPCRLVSTQVIEAGVDLDFPRVLRAIGPLDRIVQAAGRCNREGRLTDEYGRPVMGKVVVFFPEDGSIPRGVYTSGLHQAAGLLKQEGVDLHIPELYKKYFEMLYQIVDTSGREVQTARKSFRFADTAEKFRMIKNNTVPVVVRYTEESEKLINRIGFSNGVTRDVMRQIQPYLVNVYEYQLKSLEREGLIKELSPGLYEWLGIYNPVRGISDKARDPETLVF